MSAIQQVLLSFGSGGGGGTDPNYANVGLLLHFDVDSPFIDNSPSVKTITTSGAAFASATQSRFGGKSMAIGGGGGWLTTPHDTSLDFPTGDFSIEVSVYPASLASNMYIITKNSGTGVFPWCLYWRAGSTRLEFLGFDSGGSLGFQLISSIPLTANAWNVLCATRSGNTFEISNNGASGGTLSYSGTLYSNPSGEVAVGASQNGSEPVFNGYIDEVRITKGVVRSNAVPSAAFPNS